MANDPEYITGPWSTADIVSVSLILPIVIAAFLESFLWVAAFLYCFVKAFMKADHWSQKVLAMVFAILHIILKGVFLPVMIVTLPLPARITQTFPEPLKNNLRFVAFYCFALMLIVPWLICLYRIIVIPLGRSKRVLSELDEDNAPKIVVVMPVYKEPPDILWTALNSVVTCDYPAACIHVFLSFDGDNVDELYLKTIERLGVPITLKEFPKSIDVAYGGARVTISRFPHGGKRHCQKSTFLLIDKIYKKYVEQKDDMFILFIDSDCILDPVCIQNFMYDMELRAGNKREMLAMTGIITCHTDKHSLLTLLQDTEYLHGQLFERSVESGCGAVTCLPGALTMLRFSAFRNVARFYFSDKAEQCEDIFDYAKQVLGEDRWLTHLFMLGAKKRYQIQLSTSAFCKTEAVQTFRSLLKQRRRWFLGFITNEVCMLTDGRLWKQYPLLLILRFVTLTVRTTTLLLLITLIAVASTSSGPDILPWEFMLLSLGLGWLMMFWFAFKLHRWKALLYPLMWFLNPFLNWLFMVYGIFTAGQRTWGGPRADAGAADSKVTPQQAIEQAQATGDDLNVVPETFRPAVEFRKRRTRPSALQPSPSVEGRFVSAEEEPTYLHLSQKDFEAPIISHDSRRRRFEQQSLDMSDTDDVSIHTPKYIHSLSEAGPSNMDGAMDGPLGSRPRPRKVATIAAMPSRGRMYSDTAEIIPSARSMESAQDIGDERVSDSVGDTRRSWPSSRVVHTGHRTSESQSMDHRSPLGRNSPLTNLSAEELDEVHHQHQLTMDTLQGRSNAGSANAKSSQPPRRNRLRKRSASPGSMV